MAQLETANNKLSQLQSENDAYHQAVIIKNDTISSQEDEIMQLRNQVMDSKHGSGQSRQQQQDLQNHVNSLQNKLTTSETANTEKTAAISAMSAQIQSIRAENTSLSGAISALKAREVELVEAHNQALLKIAQLESQASENTADMAKKQASIKAMIDALHAERIELDLSLIHI